MKKKIYHKRAIDSRLFLSNFSKVHTRMKEFFLSFCISFHSLDEQTNEQTKWMNLYYCRCDLMTIIGKTLLISTTFFFLSLFLCVPTRSSIELEFIQWEGEKKQRNDDKQWRCNMKLTSRTDCQIARENTRSKVIANSRHCRRSHLESNCIVFGQYSK